MEADSALIERFYVEKVKSKPMRNHPSIANYPLIPDGVWPTMITPFKNDRSIDWDKVDELVEWFIEEGVAGIFAVCLSSEMYHLSETEKLVLAQRVVETTRGRVPVIAVGNFGKTIKEQAEFTQKMYNTGVDAVIIVASLLAPQDASEEVVLKKFKKLVSLTGTIPLGLYECPKPFPRYLSPDMLSWVLSTQRFVFFKETEASWEHKKQKMDLIKEHNQQFSPKLKFFPANVTHLLKCLQYGAHGFCGISSNHYGSMFVWLCQNFASQKENAEILENHLSVVEKTTAVHWPMSGKKYLHDHVRRFKNMEPVCRTETGTWNEEEVWCLASQFASNEFMKKMLKLDSFSQTANAFTKTTVLSQTD